MTKIILQPYRDALAYEHFQETVATKVKLSSINRFLTAAQRKTLASIYPDGMCNVWGVEPKKKDLNVRKWERIRPGDIVFFARNKRIHYSGIVTLTIRNKEAAFRLWKDNRKTPPSTWECMYFLADINPLDIAVQDFNEIKGNKLTANIQGFTVLYEDESRFILQQLGIDDIESSTKEMPASEAEAEKALKNLPETNRITSAIARKEHNLLTSLLHGKRVNNECAICHKTFPTSLLNTAHIKKRANCTHEERVNRYIVMPLCTLGCDELYERGYISIVNGKIVALRKKPLTEAVRKYIAGIEGNDCSYYNETTKGFFDWHHDHHKNKYFLQYRLTD
jgi:hypothetical protein